MPTAEDFARIYARSEYHDVHYADLQSRQFDCSLRLLGQFVGRSSLVLDFGCGCGEFLIEAKAEGYLAEGVELEQSARDAAMRNSGCRVRSLEDIELGDGAYDAIHIGDVLEHLPDPERMMRRLERFLSRDGIFIVEGPLEENRSAVKWVASAVRWIKWWTGRSNYSAAAPLHLTRTSARSQKSFFDDRMGFRTLVFQIYESGWPYAEPWSEIFSFRDLATTVRGLIGKFAIGLSVVANLFGLGFGDRFVAVVVLPARGAQK